MATYNDTITDDIANSLSFTQLSDQTYGFDYYLYFALSQTGIPISACYENFEMSSEVSSFFGAVIKEVMNLIHSKQITGTYSYVFSDSVAVNDILTAVYTLLLNEDLTLSLSEVNTKNLIDVLIDVLTISRDTNVQSNYSTTLLAALSLYDVIKAVELGQLVDSLEISSQILENLSWASEVLDSITLSQSEVPILRMFSVIEEDYSISSLLENFAAGLAALIEDSIVFTTTFEDPLNISTFVLNPEITSISTYSNFKFESATEFNNEYLFCSPTGLYKHEGTTDNGSFITGIIKTASMDFGISNKKQMPTFYLGVDNDSKLILRASVDGRNTAYYQLNLDSQNLDTQHIKLGKGLVGRYWQFEIQTKENEGLDIDTIEFYPITFGRKI